MVALDKMDDSDRATAQEEVGRMAALSRRKTSEREEADKRAGR